MSEQTTNFFDMDRITVPLTYLFTDPPTAIRFFCKIALSNDDAAARQAFYAKSNDDQAAGQHAYNVDFLARISIAKPEGLPGFDEFANERFTAGDVLSDGELVKAFLGEDNEMKRKVAADAIQLYNRYTQPPEFFR